MRTSSRKTPPIVLIVDDVGDEARAAAVILGKKVKAICRLPGDVQNRDLLSASLVLVDFRIEDWDQRDQLSSPSLKPQNGLALVATLRSNLSGAVTRSPTAFALRSGRLADVSGGYEYQGRQHVLARMYNLEWVFAKSDNQRDFVRQVSCLADAVKKLPHPWPPLERRRRALSRFLALSSAAPWVHTANEDLDRAFPPEDVLSEASRGLAVVRWLLQEVFPYPGPLLDSRYLAARLHLDPESFSTAIAGPRTSGINRALAPYEYRGALSGFLGRRWWRAGIEHWLWRRTKGRSLDKDVVIESLKRLIPDANAYSHLRQPVVKVDDQFRPTDTLIELTEAVQLRPDEWPPAADAAWTLKSEVVGNPALIARVDLRDRERIRSPNAAVDPT